MLDTDRQLATLRRNVRLSYFFSAACAIFALSAFLLGASADHNNLVVDSLKAKSIIVQGDNTKQSLQIISNQLASGMWIVRDKDTSVGLYATPAQGPALSFNVKNRPGVLAISAQDGPVLQIRGNDGVFTLGDLHQLFEAAGILPAKDTNPPPTLPPQ